MKATTLDSPLGPLRLVSTGEALVGVYFPGHKPPPRYTAPDGTDPILRMATAQLEAWLAGRLRDFTVPIQRAGTPFQERVWAQLDGIPYGRTRTYQHIAQAIGRPSASRAVGAAVGRNPLSIVVPCHRVLGASGKITGFAGGVTRKQWLLDHERGGRLL